MFGLTLIKFKSVSVNILKTEERVIFWHYTRLEESTLLLARLPAKEIGANLFFVNQESFYIEDQEADLSK